MTLGLGTLAVTLLAAAAVYLASGGTMTGDAKNVSDVILTILGMGGAIIAFQQTIREWRESQRWKRSEYLDKLIEKFEGDERVQLACTAIDWTARTTEFRGRKVTLTNYDVLRSLRPHAELQEGETYEGEQSIIREAFDSLLNYFCRLESAIATDLIDRSPAKDYFEYWLKRFVTMDRHPVRDTPLGGKQPGEMAAAYIAAYSDIKCIVRLCRHFDIDVSHPLRKRAEETEKDVHVPVTTLVTE